MNFEPPFTKLIALTIFFLGFAANIGGLSIMFESTKLYWLMCASGLVGMTLATVTGLFYKMF